MKSTISVASKFALKLAGMTALFAQTASPSQAANVPALKGASPALCGVGDNKEPGIQGDVPSGVAPNFNCGVKLIGQLDTRKNPSPLRL